jgi:iron complex outermembrane recepter protein
MKREITRLMGIVCLLFFYSFLQAQSGMGVITGKVMDPEGEPVAFANVVLHTVADSAMAKVEYTDDHGAFTLANIASGNYWLNISFVGLPTYNSTPFELQPGQRLDLQTIQLKNAVNELKEVVVTAQRPILEVKPDKLVFNIDGSVNATGSDALELLRKAPGVVVDNNENITLLGKSGVQIYIDGKPSPLSSTDLAAFLKNMQSSEIDAIEIITNPSSRYEAQGNAGIINIKMKKDKRLGANGNLNLGYNVGEVARYNGSLSGNYRNQKYNAFGSYSYNEGQNTNFMDLYREQNGLVFDQHGRQGGGWKSHNFKAGADFFLNDKNTLGFLVNGYVSDNTWNGASRTTIGKIGQTGIDSILIARSRNIDSRDNVNFNVNYRFDDSKGVIWNLDADYGMFRNDGREFQPNYYYDPTESVVLQERINSNETPTNIDISTFKVDHERPFLKGQLGAGAKFSYVQTDNTFDFYTEQDGAPVLDIDRSNQFEYTENVNAAYVNYSRKIDKISFQMGLRVEQTNSVGDLTSMKPTDNDRVERNYLDFFPSGGITYAANEKHNFQLSYSRRVNRPSYQDLNPFENKLDELTFQKGNPFLRPEYTHNVQLTHSFNYKFNTTVGFSHTKDMITRQTDVADETASYITWLNLADRYNYNVGVSAPLPITEWWSSFTNLSGVYMKNKADFGEGKVIDIDATAFNVYSQQTFRLPWDVSFEVSGWYNSGGIWGGNFEMEDQWSVDAGVQKKILDGRGNLKLSVSDIFKTTNWYGSSLFGDLFLNVHGGWDSRRFRLNFSYLIGNTQVKGARKRATGLEDEQKRVGGGQQ